MKIKNFGKKVVEVVVIWNVWWELRRNKREELKNKNVLMEVIMIEMLRWKFVNVI